MADTVQTEARQCESSITILPHGVCVYRHVVDGVVIYVGKGNAERPFEVVPGEHDCGPRNAQWTILMRQARSITVEIVGWYRSDAEAAEAEAREIQECRPVANIIRPRLRTQKFEIVPRLMLLEELRRCNRIGRKYAESIGKGNIPW